MMEEIWKVIEDSPNYSVSSFGRFRNNRNGKILKQSVHRNKGYCWVTLTSISSGKRKTYQAHSLVAKYFCQNPHNYIEVNHIDGDKTNNHPKNLEWVTRSENLKHAYKLGLRPRKTKATESNKKKCFVKIKETDEILEFESMTQASYYFNKAQTWACGVIRGGGETKKYKVWQWKKEVD